MANQICGAAFSTTQWLKTTVLCCFILFMSEFSFGLTLNLKRTSKNH